MKNFFLFLFAFVIGAFSIVAVGVYSFTKSPVNHWEGTVRLEIINADVLVKQDGLPYHLVTGDIILKEGDSVKTDFNGEAEILIADGAIIRLAPETELVINKANLESLWKQDVNVSLSTGKIWFRIIKIFDDGSSWEVETPTVVATVRGTAFGMEMMEDGELDFLVAESEVFVKEKNEEARQAVVVAGQRMEIGQDFVVKKDKLQLNNKDDQELRTWLNDNLELDKEYYLEVQDAVNVEIAKNLEQWYYFKLTLSQEVILWKSGKWYCQVIAAPATVRYSEYEKY
jgi:hypothetical protein